MFSDFISTTPYGWEYVPVEASGPNPALSSRRFKCNPHASPLLSDYDVTIWIDGNFSITSREFVTEVLGYLHNEILLSAHPHRGCAYEEMDVCEAVDGVDDQRIAYREMGFPSHFGLYCGGLIVRNMKATATKSLGDMWWDHVTRFSARDQISLSYCLWACKIKPDLTPKLFWNEPGFPYFEWFGFQNHLK